MTRNDSGTLDLFQSSPSTESLAGEWPDARRFPLNQDNQRVGDVVLRDLCESVHPLIVTGFASLDRLIDFISTADGCEKIRVVLGSEPYPSRRDTFAIHDKTLPQEIREYWIEKGISVRLSAKLIHCIRKLETGMVQMRYVARSGWRLHAKIYVGDEAVTLGSSNFTDSGLRSQLEANTRFERNAPGKKAIREEEQRRYLEAAQIAEQFWDVGNDYNAQLIELLNELLRLVTWREAIARAATELLEGEWAKAFLRGEYLPGDAMLWPSQRLGIAQALYILKERGSVLFADATGSGKTRAGVHLIGAKMHEIISSNRLRQGKALMVCPPAVRSSWERESGLAGVAVDIYSHGALSNSRSSDHKNLLTNLHRAQLLCVDEGHNFLNVSSNRTQQLFRNMADHVALFTATPINRSATDLLRMADMLGADNLDPSTVKAFEKMLNVRSISRSLTEEEISQLRREIAKFTVRRTKRMLNDLIKKEPDAYRDARGRRCRFPDHEPKTYSLDESTKDCAIAAQIRELSGQLKGVLYFRGRVALPEALKRRGVSEKSYLDGRLTGAGKLSQYMVMRSLRSSCAALLEHLLGTEVTVKRYELTQLAKNTASGNVIESVSELADKLPTNQLSIQLPDWLDDVDAHRKACDEEVRLYCEIADLAGQLSDQRERKKAKLLGQLSLRFDHVLAFDSRPITLSMIKKLIKQSDVVTEVLVATGDPSSGRGDLLARFAPDSEESGKTIGLCSDSVAEGVNLQRGQVVVHLDMPSVVRIAEQRVGRVDRLDSPHKKIYAWWPDDAEEFALRTDERFIERYETVDNLLGSNLPLPDKVRASSKTFTAKEAIKDFDIHAEQWDGIEDAFSPVRDLVEGNNALIPHDIYDEYANIKARVMAHVSLVSADRPWAFFCTNDDSGVPKWIFLSHRNAKPQTDLHDICNNLRKRLGADVKNIHAFTPIAERILEQFLVQLVSAERKLLSPRKQKALTEMEKVLDVFRHNASARNEQATVDILSGLLGAIQSPDPESQPNWEEVAARWLDLIRPVWYRRLHDSGRRKPLLLKDIRQDVVRAEKDLLPRLLNELGKGFPVQRSVEQRIVAAVIGVG